MLHNEFNSSEEVEVTVCACPCGIHAYVETQDKPSLLLYMIIELTIRHGRGSQLVARQCALCGPCASFVILWHCMMNIVHLISGNVTS